MTFMPTSVSVLDSLAMLFVVAVDPLQMERLPVEEKFPSARLDLPHPKVALNPVQDLAFALERCVQRTKAWGRWRPFSKPTEPGLV